MLPVKLQDQSSHSNIDDLIHAADAARESKNHVRAARLYAEVAAIAPGRPDLFVQAGNMAKEAGQFARSLAAYQSALPHLDKDPDLPLQIGHLRKLRGEIDEAARAYAASLALDPYASEAYHELIALGRAELAYATVLKALPAPPEQQPVAAQKKMAIFTIAAHNYVAQASVLLESAGKVYPEAELFQIVCDCRRPGDAPSPHAGTLVYADELGIRNFDDLAFRYDIMELSTALKPFAIQHLIKRYGFETVLYFDPDVYVYDRSREALEALQAGASVVLTPHLLTSSGTRGEPDDVAILRAGAFNLGFIAVGNTPEALQFLDWWADHLQFKCFDWTSNGLFVDQKFLDLAPSLFKAVHICRSPAANVAYWNLGERTLSGDGAGSFTVDGQPLEFFHFSGYSTEAPHRLSRFTRIGEHVPQGILRTLLTSYGRALIDNGVEQAAGEPYGYGRFSSGRVVNRSLRRLFAKQCLAFRGDPFAAYEAHSLDTTSTWPNGLAVPYAIAALERQVPALESLMATPAAIARPRLIDWLLTEAPRDTGYPLAYLRDAARRLGWTGSRRSIAPDVALVGYFQHRSGMGESARRIAATLSAAGIEFEICDISDGVPHERDVADMAAPTTYEPKAPIEILVVNLDQVEPVLDIVDRDGPEPYRILMPFWETDRIPDIWQRALASVDEVWAATSFLQEVFSSATDRTVTEMPVFLDTPWQGSRGIRAFLDIEESACLFVLAYDAKSFSERKNPLAAIEAFQAACRLTPGMKAGARLLIKTLNGRHDPQTLLAMDRAAASDPSIVLWDADLSGADHADLLASADAIVSLHRSEGLGYLVSDAIASGIPVIATGFGGPRDFLPETGGWRIPHRSIVIERGQYPFSGGHNWAEPDVEAAAMAISEIYRDPALAKSKARNFQQQLKERYGLAASAARFSERLQQIFEKIGGSPLHADREFISLSHNGSHEPVRDAAQ